MAGRKMTLVGFLAIVSLVYFGWTLTARGAYESATYTVLVSDAQFEQREYPDLMMATTHTQFDSQGNDGSFMRLFRYIQGENVREQKVAMTTPVFMDSGDYHSRGEMGFVIPQNVAARQIPEPTEKSVQIRKRVGGRFAVIRFNGRISAESFAKAESELRAWMANNGLVGKGDAEFAGYDPPWTPGPFRRNEILIRLKPHAD